MDIVLWQHPSEISKNKTSTMVQLVMTYDQLPHAIFLKSMARDTR